MSPISDALKSLFLENGITSRKQLDKWCDGSRDKLYRAIQMRVPTAWETLAAPTASVRAAYETMLSGFKHYNAPTAATTTNSAAASVGIVSIPTAPKMRERKARKTAHPVLKASAPVLIVKVLIEPREASVRLRST